MIELLRKFTKPDHETLKDVHISRHYRGDGTETWQRRMRAMIGEAAAANLHFDTVACDGRVYIVVPRARLDGAVEEPFGMHILTAEHHWAMGEVDERSDEVSKASAATIQRVPVETARKLYDLPGLEFVDVARVNFWEYGKTKKRRSKPAPQDVVYFRFEGGYGCVYAPKPEGGK